MEHSIHVLLSEKKRISDLLFKSEEKRSERMIDELLKILFELDRSVKILKELTDQRRI